MAMPGDSCHGWSLAQKKTLFFSGKKEYGLRFFVWEAAWVIYCLAKSLNLVSMMLEYFT